MTMTPSADSTALDPFPLVTGLASLRRLTGMYPASHPVITNRLDELNQIVQQYLREDGSIQIDIMHGSVHLNGASFGDDSPAHAQTIQELAGLGVDSIHIRDGIEPDELLKIAGLLWELKDRPEGDSIEQHLARLGVRHASLGRLVPLDTRWQKRQWPDAPTEDLDPAYAEAMVRTEQAFDTVASGKGLSAVTVRDLVKLLVHEVARSSVALSQILAIKNYENLTYCHSVNVAMLSLMLGKQIGLDERTTGVLVEAALLHDIGKTKIPLDIVKKPGALDKAERKLIQAHTTRGAEILADTDGLHPLTPTVALEHHRSVKGGGYPELGDGIVPHPLSQIVSVADVYEALTGARSYQEPRLPEQACLVLARLAGDVLNTALVKAFVAAVTFFPVGSLVRTTLGETGVVVQTNPSDPLHPIVVLMSETLLVDAQPDRIDTSARDESGAYERHIAATLPVQAHRAAVTNILQHAGTF